MFVYGSSFFVELCSSKVLAHLVEDLEKAEKADSKKHKKKKGRSSRQQPQQRRDEEKADRDGTDDKEGRERQGRSGIPPFICIFKLTSFPPPSNPHIRLYGDLSPA